MTLKTSYLVVFEILSCDMMKTFSKRKVDVKLYLGKKIHITDRIPYVQNRNYFSES